LNLVNLQLQMVLLPIPQEIVILAGIQTVGLAVPAFLGLILSAFLETVVCFLMLPAAELLAFLNSILLAIGLTIDLTIDLTIHASVSRQTAGCRAGHLGDTCSREGENESEDDGQNKE
jgi:hypothetical protein